MDNKLISLATAAIQDQNAWHRVLQHIVSSTCAEAVIITLREKSTCQIVNDDALVQRYHSPLIWGFPIEGVVYYLEELRTIDPWAEAQRTHHPHRPTLMSGVCDPKKVEDKRFFSWLNAQGIFDTIAFELEMMPGYWTACNFFLSKPTTEEVRELMDYANEHHPFLREAWQAGQAFLRNSQSGQAALEQLSGLGIAACIVDSQGNVQQSNSAIKMQQELDQVRLVGPKQRLSLPIGAEFHEIDSNLSKRFHRHECDSSECIVRAQTIDADPLYQGRKNPNWLITIGGPVQRANRVDRTHFDISVLTKQERQLFLAVRSGDRVVDAGKAIGVQRSRVFEIWGSVKKKLGVKSAHSLRS